MNLLQQIYLTHQYIVRIVFLFLMALALYGCVDDSSNSVSQRNTFIPFKHMSGVVPGKTRKSQALLMLGEPDSSNVSMHGVLQTDKGPREFGGHESLHYTTFGMTLLISREDLKMSDPTIDTVIAKEGYKGVAPNGLRIGMDITEALQICDHDYARINNFGDTYHYAVKRGGSSDFYMLFSQKKLSKINMTPNN